MQTDELVKGLVVGVLVIVGLFQVNNMAPSSRKKREFSISEAINDLNEYEIETQSEKCNGKITIY